MRVCIHLKTIPFTVDTTHPTTTLRIRDSLFNFEQSFVNKTSWQSDFFQKAVLTFTCKDPSPDKGIEFGCGKTLYCEGINCNPSKELSNLTFTETKSICYHSLDKGNNAEPIMCGTVQVSGEGPSIKITEPIDDLSITDNVVDVKGTFTNIFSISEFVGVQSGTDVSGGPQ